MSALDTGVVSHGVTESRVGQHGFPWGKALRHLLLIVFLAIVLIPVYVLLVTSFKTQTDAQPAHAWLLPNEWTLENWKKAWNGPSAAVPGVGPAMIRTFQLVIPSTIISAFLGSMNGYVLSRWRFPHANAVFTFLLFGMFIPYQAVMVPLYRLVQWLKPVTSWVDALPTVPDGIPILILLHVVYGIPITTLIFRNYYESVPQELIEAARVDGAGMLRTYASVVLPISVPSFVVVLIWQFTSAWNDFLFAKFFVANPDKSVVTIALNNLAGGSIMSDHGVEMAAALLASFPTLIIYVALGKYFLGGLMAGSVKG
ncbi:MAG: carbohydrate ABC transporter permease [Bifidobacteriaceae bacterium]|jgi:glucose/mannose transport system permease protein|nr:carbohydrate ABC transporter permease [Bifidobacteriaceae bacterium]